MLLHHADPPDAYCLGVLLPQRLLEERCCSDCSHLLISIITVVVSLLWLHWYTYAIYVYLHIIKFCSHPRTLHLYGLEKVFDLRDESNYLLVSSFFALQSSQSIHPVKHYYPILTSTGRTITFRFLFLTKPGNTKNHSFYSLNLAIFIHTCTLNQFILFLLR